MLTCKPLTVGPSLDQAVLPVMNSRSLLTLFQILLIMIASLHCALEHRQLSGSAIASVAHDSAPQPQHNPCQRAGCLCKGAVFGQKVVFSVGDQPAVGERCTFSSVPPAMVNLRRMASASWLADLHSHGESRVRAHLQAYLL
jgi:hypothetical protein